MLGGGMHGFGFWGLGNLGWFGMVLGLIINIGIIVGVILLIAWFVKRLSASDQGPSAGGAGPREILQARYARGEITREQYQEFLTDLGL